MREDYENLNGKKIAIIWRKKGREKTDKCPFCGSKHIHGRATGLRIKHCASHVVKDFTAQDGSFFAANSSYIIKEY